MKKFHPITLSKYLINEFNFSILIFLGIFISLVLLTNYVQELVYFKDKNIEEIYFKALLLTVSKTLSIIITLSPFLFLFSGIHFFVKLTRKNEISPLKLSGFSNNFICLLPSIYSFFLGILIIIILTPVSSKLSKYYESSKQRYNNNDNLIILSPTGLWLKQENNENNHIIIRADKTSDQDFKILKNITIYKVAKNNLFLERLDSEEAKIEEKQWILKNTYISKDEKQIFYEDLVFKTSINFKHLKEFFTNSEVYSVWDINKEINLIQKYGYFGYELIIAFNKYLALPFLLFAMIMISSHFTINLNYNLNIFAYAFIGILLGILIYFLIDISIALGKGGKIPLVLSVWFPVLVVLLLSSYNLFNVNEK